MIISPARLLTVAVLAASLVSGMGTLRCANMHHPAALESKLYRRQGNGLAPAAPIDICNLEPINVETYINVVAASKFSAGYLKVSPPGRRAPGFKTRLMVPQRETVDKQVEVMQKRFEPSKISFTVMGVQWIVNASWSNSTKCGSYYEMNSIHRKGNASTLNLYIVESLTSKGLCYNDTFPVLGGATIRSISTYPGVTWS